MLLLLCVVLVVAACYLGHIKNWLIDSRITADIHERWRCFARTWRQVWSTFAVDSVRTTSTVTASKATMASLPGQVPGRRAGSGGRSTSRTPLVSRLCRASRAWLAVSCHRRPPPPALRPPTWPAPWRPRGSSSTRTTAKCCSSSTTNTTTGELANPNRHSRIYSNTTQGC